MSKQYNFDREGEWPAAVRGVVKDGIKANPSAAEVIKKFGNELCAPFLLQRWGTLTEVERQRVLSKLERWRQCLEQHDVKPRHYSSIFHETAEQARRHAAPRSRNLYDDEHHLSPDSASHDDASRSSSSASDSEPEYPPVPPYRQGHSSPYFVPPPPRRDRQSPEGESPYRMSAPLTSERERKKPGLNHFLDDQAAPGSYVAGVRAVVQAAGRADPEAEAGFLQLGRALCQDAIVQRFNAAPPSIRQRVQERLELWRRELEAGNFTRHSFRWLFGTTEEEQQDRRRKYVESTQRQDGSGQALEAAGASAGHSRARDGSAESRTLFDRRSSRSSSEPREHGSDSEGEYPPVPPYLQGHSSPYFLSTPPRRGSQSPAGESPYHALGRRAGASVTVLQRRRGGAGSGTW
ncbi:hypothetical protein JCM8208_002309 [Rhodotorula glutinis]